MWAGYLIVAVVVLIIAAVLALLGKKALDNAQPVAGARHRPGPADHRGAQEPLGEPTVTTPPTTGAASAGVGTASANGAAASGPGGPANPAPSA